MTMRKIRPFLWFNKNAEQAARFYVSIFKNSKIISTSSMMTTFRLEGLEIIALNGGPHYKITPAISFFVTCRTQAEVDYFWKKLSAGGEILRCGWLTDKFGLTWQIVPSILGDLLGDDDDEKSSRTMQAMLKMRKLDIAKLKKAHAGR